MVNTGDARTARGRALDPKAPEPGSAAAKEFGYKFGYQDATDQTVDMAKTTGGKRALQKLAEGEDRPYRKAMKRRRPL